MFKKRLTYFGFIVFSIIFVFLFETKLVQAQWPAISKTTKPWTRWWWMGSAVNEADLRIQLKAFAAAGFGGVEIVPIYGAKGYEKKFINYLSKDWMAKLDFCVKEGAKLGMGVDVSVGTGWPIGGPQVMAEDGASKFLVQRYLVSAQKPLTENIRINDKKQEGLNGVGLSAAMAYHSTEGSIDITKFIDADGKLNWMPPAGEWEIYALFNAKTRQEVKRSAPGGEGYTLDHFSKKALNNYLSRFDEAYGNDSRGVRSFFNDSYEVYGANWTPDFFDVFAKKRGYSLQPYIREVFTQTNANTDLVSRLKSDYRETMAELMLYNFSEKFTSWAHSKKALSTNQAHGSPGNLLDLYAAVDIAESETFGSSYFPIPGLRRDSQDIRNVDPDPIMLQFASSAAHVTGHKFASTETFTWLTEHFKTSWSQCKPELEQVFLSGINHVFYHGSTYSPKAAKWPGWLFYASVNFVPNNSLWPHLKGLNQYIGRCQSVLQAGSPDNELLMYWPVYDVWHKEKGTDMPLKVHDVDEWLHPTPFYKNVIELQKSGFALDFVSDKMIGEATVNESVIRIKSGGAKYKVLVVPACRFMPFNVLSKLIKMAETGADIIFQALPTDVPGLSNLDANRKELARLIESIKFAPIGDGIQVFTIGKGKIILSPDISKGLNLLQVNREKLTDAGLKFIRRNINGEKYYYIVNHQALEVDSYLPLNIATNQAVIMDPQSGKTGRVVVVKKNGENTVRIQLKPGEAWIVRASNKTSGMGVWRYLNMPAKSIEIKGPWNLAFTAGGPTLPAPAKLAETNTWTSLADTNVHNFSGTGVYSTQFKMASKINAEYLLNFSGVHESAKVFINGNYAGMAWSIPYRLRVGQWLKPGVNSIRIEVANLMANRIRYMDRSNQVWRNYHEINFVNINYKAFDAANWPVQPSGLSGPVTLTVHPN